MSHGTAPTPAVLIFFMLVFAAVTLIIALTAHRRARCPAVHLAWLDDVTFSLRARRPGGRRTSPSEVALAIAIGGAAMFPAYALMTEAFVAPDPGLHVLELRRLQLRLLQLRRRRRLRRRAAAAGGGGGCSCRPAQGHG